MSPDSPDRRTGARRPRSAAGRSRSTGATSLGDLWARITPQRGTQLLIAFATVAVLLATGYAWRTVNTLEASVTRAALSELGNGDDGAVDILMVGMDSRTDAKGNPLSAKELKAIHSADDVGSNTDTIVLIRIPNDGSSATAVSIPRDSYVNVPGIGMSKINAAYGATKEAKRRQLVEAGDDPADAEKQGATAGREALIKTVADLTGIEVDHYAEVGLLGFMLLTDAVDGVQVCLKNAVDEPMSGAHFPAGTQTLDGSQALSFVRQRHDLPRGDLDRIVRQQVFMASLAGKVLSTGTLTSPGKLKSLEKAVSRAVVIDDDWNVVNFVSQLKDISGGAVRFSTIPVVTEQGWSDDGTQSVVEVDPTAVHKYMTSLLTSKKRGESGFIPSTVTADVENGSTIDGLAGAVSQVLSGKGFTAGALTTQGTNDVNSAVHARSGQAGADVVAKALGGLPVVVDDSVPADHVKVILTNTYNGPTGDGGATSTQTTPNPAPNITANTSSGPKCVN